MVKSPEKAIPIEDLNIEIFADGADIEGIISLNKNPIITTLDTNLQFFVL